MGSVEKLDTVYYVVLFPAEGSDGRDALHGIGEMRTVYKSEHVNDQGECKLGQLTIAGSLPRGQEVESASTYEDKTFE